MNGLLDAVKVAADAVLPPDTPAVEPVQAMWNKNDMQATKGRLSGAVLETRDGAFFVVPPLGTTGDATASKIFVSRTGNMGQVNQETIGQLGTAGVVRAALGVFFAEGEEEAPGLKCNGLPATLSPVDSASGALASLKIIVGGGEPHLMSVADALSAVGVAWQPWEGAEGAAPPIPVAPGIVTAALSAVADMPHASLIGADALAPLRHATLVTLGVFANDTTGRGPVRVVAEFAAALAGQGPYARALGVAIASATAAGEAQVAMPVGSTLLAAAVASQAVLTALREAIDSLGMPAIQQVATDLAALRLIGFTTGGAQAGHYAAAQMAKAANLAIGVSAAVTAASAAQQAAQQAAQTTALQAVMNLGGAPPPLVLSQQAAMRVEAERRFDATWQVVGGGAAPLAGAQRQSAIDGMVALMAASALAPPANMGAPAVGGQQAAAAGAGAAAPAAAGGAAAPAAAGAAAVPPVQLGGTGGVMFAALRTSAGLVAPAADVLAHISAARGVQPVQIAEGLATARGRIFSTLFGTATADLVDVASDDYEFIVAATGSAWDTQPQSWGESALRLQRICVLHQQTLANAAAAPAPAAAAAYGTGGGAGTHEADETRTSIAVSTGPRSALSTILRPLSLMQTVVMEAGAETELDPVAEVVRLRGQPYGYAAMSFIYSDGTYTGSKLPARGEHRL
jgi:hypothetical protein